MGKKKQQQKTIISCFLSPHQPMFWGLLQYTRNNLKQPCYNFILTFKQQQKKNLNEKCCLPNDPMQLFHVTGNNKLFFLFKWPYTTMTTVVHTVCMYHYQLNICSKKINITIHYLGIKFFSVKFILFKADHFF